MSGPEFVDARDAADVSGARVGRSSAISPVLSVLVAVLFQSHVLRHELRHDDLVHCFELLHQGAGKFLFAPYGGHVMPVHKLAYAALVPWFGLEPRPYFLLALATHGASVFVLQRLLLVFTRDAVWSSVWAALWGTSLACAGTLVWFACYGQAQATLATLLVLHDLFQLRAQGRAPGTGRVALWGALLLAGALSFGIGVSVAAALPAVAFLAFEKKQRWGVSLRVLPFSLAIVVLYVVLQRRGGESMGVNDLTLALTPRVVLQLVVYGVAALLLPPFFAGVEDGKPWGPLHDLGDTALLAVAAGVTILVTVPLVVSLRGRPKGEVRRWSALPLLLLANFTLIALGRIFTTIMLGGSLMSITTAPRYHYLNGAILTALLATGLHGSSRVTAFQRSRRFAAAAAVLGAASLVGSFELALGMDRADSILAREGRERLGAKIVAEARKAAPASIVFVANEKYRPTQRLFNVGVPPTRFPHDAAAWAISHRGDRVEGRTVRFVEQDPALVEWLRRTPASPITRLVVGRTEAGNDWASSVIDMGNARHRTQILRGVLEPEGTDAHAWAERVFAVRLTPPGSAKTRGALLRVHFYVPDVEIQTVGAFTVQARSANTTLSSQTIREPGTGTLEFDVPAPLLRAPEVEFDFEMDKHFVQPDARELCLVVNRFELVSR